MTFVYWNTAAVPRVFYNPETKAERRRVEALNLPEGGCKTVGGWTYMRLPDKPVLSLDGADSVLQPAPNSPRSFEQSDLKFF